MTDIELTDDELKIKLTWMQIETLRQQHENRHINPKKFQQAKKVSQQLRMWKEELDRKK
jgi:hypothetical protein